MTPFHRSPSSVLRTVTSSHPPTLVHSPERKKSHPPLIASRCGHLLHTALLSIFIKHMLPIHGLGDVHPAAYFFFLMVASVPYLSSRPPRPYPSEIRSFNPYPLPIKNTKIHKAAHNTREIAFVANMSRLMFSDVMQRAT